jgi:hypothetical protein
MTKLYCTCRVIIGQGEAMPFILIISVICLFIFDLGADGRVGQGGPTRNAFGIYDSSWFPNKPEYDSNYCLRFDIIYDTKRVIYEPIYIANLLKQLKLSSKLPAYTLIGRSTKFRPPP